MITPPLDNPDYHETVANQRMAASPALSAWVSANAGSGKTRVLIDRVARLLLAGNDPASILCITFTKAAAAEMTNRLFDMLGRWSLEDDETLRQSLQNLTGSEEHPTAPFGPADLSRARRLFARALETPGGLKIQTIHAFCDHILRRFPLEAGIPPGFDVVESRDQKELMKMALDRVGDATEQQPELTKALTHLTTKMDGAFLESQLQTFLYRREYYLRMVEHWGGLEHGLKGLSDFLAISAEQTPANVIEQCLDGIDPKALKNAIALMETGKANAQKYAGILSTALACEGEARFNHLIAVFLTQQNAPRKTLIDKELSKREPLLDDQLRDWQSTILETIENLKKFHLYTDTKHFFTLASEYYTAYETLKAEKACLDFDDLILRTRSLFSEADGRSRWVMYKLDNGLDHILLDEAQDTSPGQWSVIEGPLAEFFANMDAGTYEPGSKPTRSFFAVGDQKQSIYSFQGADAGLFLEKSQTIGERISAASRFRNIPLTLSFRSAAPVLGFVDAMFAHDETIEGLGEVNPLKHGVFHNTWPGSVEVWPPVPKPEKLSINPWDAPVDQLERDNPVKCLCDQIAQTISHWLNGQTLPVGMEGPVSPGDILILVQRRHSLFAQVLKSLSAYGIPVAGADRLKLSDDIGVQDLLSYGKFCLMQEDDLSLAEILKSPFFDWDDDQLFNIAHKRDGSLWESICQHAQDDEVITESVINPLRGHHRLAREQGPYAFFMAILEHGTPSGRARLAARLGAGYHEAIDAFLAIVLNFENTHGRCLQSFITWFEQNTDEIKRELDRTDHQVRVMTVHGAKGLESKIVFIIDGHLTPSRQKIDPLYYFAPDQTPLKGPLPLFATRREDHTTHTVMAYEDARRLMFEEHRRLLYVAATRAEQHLIVCGLADGQNTDIKPLTSRSSWLDIAVAAMEKLQADGTVVEHVPWDGWPGTVLAYRHNPELPQSHKSEPRETLHQDKNDEIPADELSIHDETGWLHTPCTPEIANRPFAPSHLASRIELQDSLLSPSSDQEMVYPAAFPPGDEAIAKQRGNTLHKLLEILPDIPASNREDKAQAIIQQLAPDVPEALQQSWINEVQVVLNTAAFASVFSEHSRAEVSIGGRIPGLKGGQTVQGQIDRLIVEEQSVLIVDYKSNQPPPRREEDVPTAYLVQMACYRALLQSLYPDHHVQTAILWTWSARLMPLSNAILDHAFARMA